MTVNLSNRLETAREMSSAGDHRGAAAILAECVAADPDDWELLDAFLSSLERLWSKGPSEQPLPETVNQAHKSRHWDEVLRRGPADLLSHGGNVPLLRMLAEAHAAQGRHQMELRYLEGASRFAPNDIELNRHRAESLMRHGKFDLARECLERVQDISPDDAAATDKIAQLAIEQSRLEHGLESAGFLPPGKRSTPKKEKTGLKPIVYQDERMLREILRQADQHKRTPLQQLEAAVRDHTANPDLYLKLASVYMVKDRDYDAEKLLAKAKEQLNDPRVSALWEDVTMIRLDRKLALAIKNAESDDSEAAQAVVTEARKARDRFQTEVFVSRSKREPDNAELRYELGLRHKQAGKLREAYECFAAALKDDAFKALAALEMAECLRQSDQLVEALQHYRLAAESARPDQLECKKQALLEAGQLASDIRLQRLSRRYLDHLRQLDPEYAGRNE